MEIIMEKLIRVDKTEYHIINPDIEELSKPSSLTLIDALEGPVVKLNELGTFYHGNAKACYDRFKVLQYVHMKPFVIDLLCGSTIASNKYTNMHLMPKYIIRSYDYDDRYSQYFFYGANDFNEIKRWYNSGKIDGKIEGVFNLDEAEPMLHKIEVNIEIKIEE